MHPDAGIGIALSGQYTDTFEKVAGRWRFTDRLIVVDLEPGTEVPAP